MGYGMHATVSRLGLTEGIEGVLAGYLKARTTETFNSESPMYRIFGDLRSAFTTAPTIARHEFIRVRASAGQGNWARVPWIAFLDNRETKSMMSGVYCAFLFRQDMTAVYLTLTQGVAEPRRALGRTAALEFLRRRAAEVLSFATSLPARGFSSDNGIDLRVDQGLAAHYKASTITYKRYEKAAVPQQMDLLRDVEAALEGYDRFVTATR